MDDSPPVIYDDPKLPRKVVLCALAYPRRPHQATIDSIRASVPALEAAGWEHAFVPEIGNPYGFTAGRASMLRKALDVRATDVVFIDHDVSWRPQDLVKLLHTKGDVVAGTYRFKDHPDGEVYMGAIFSAVGGVPRVRKEDGALAAERVPAGFLRVTRFAVNRFMAGYPELCYGERCNPHVDLFNHGAFEFQWWGEDYAFSRRWRALGGEIWIVPDMNINHHDGDRVVEGNFHQYLMRQPGGSNDPNRIAPGCPDAS